MTRIIVYHDTETLASRARKPAPGETIGYRAKADFDEAFNATFDKVIDLSTPNQNVKKTTVKKGEGNGV
jgi:hypothetical protein